LINPTKGDTNMPDIAPFELEDGTLVYVEVEDVDRGMRRVSRGGEEKDACGRFKEALAYVRPAAEEVLNAFREMNTPDEIALEFGLKLSAELGVAFFASTKGDATFKVSLKWSNKPKAEK
jgi:hypothetical protein